MKEHSYMLVSGKSQNNICNSIGASREIVSAFQTRSQTQQNYPIAFTLCSRDCSRFPNFAKYQRDAGPLSDRSDFAAFHSTLRFSPSLLNFAANVLFREAVWFAYINVTVDLKFLKCIICAWVKQSM